MDIINNKYQTIEYDKDLSLFKITWHIQTQDISDNKFKEEILNYLEVLRKNEPQFVLWNLFNLKYTITPEIQNWFDENIQKYEKKIYKKQALLMPDEMIAELGIEQLSEEKYGKTINTKIFENKEKALIWLLT